MDRVLDDALRKGLTSVPALVGALEAGAEAGRPGVARLSRLLDERGANYRPSASEFQRQVRTLLVEAGFGFVEELEIRDEKGRFVARPDFVFLVGSR